MLLRILCVIEHTAQTAAEPVVAGITDKGRLLIIRTELLPVIRAAFLASSAGGLALAFPTVTAGTAIGDSATGLMVDTVIAIGSRDQPSVRFDLPADGSAVFADVFSDPGNFKPILEPCLDCQLYITRE